MLSPNAVIGFESHSEVQMSKVKQIAYALAAALIAAPIIGCEQIEEPWINNQAEWKQEKFETHASGPELRHRLEYTQTDR